MAIPTCEWTGASGRAYQYSVFELPVQLRPNQEGNYIFAKPSGTRWIPVYIGQGDLNERANNHHQWECIRRKGATHFHCHLNSREDDRLAEEADLLAGHPEAYQPSGCNERLGG